MAQLEDEIRAIICEITELDVDAVLPDSRLVQDLGADSMAALELMATLERTYQIVIAPENLPNMDSLLHVTELVRGLLERKQAQQVP